MTPALPPNPASLVTVAHFASIGRSEKVRPLMLRIDNHPQSGGYPADMFVIVRDFPVARRFNESAGSRVQPF